MEQRVRRAGEDGQPSSVGAVVAGAGSQLAQCKEGALASLRLGGYRGPKMPPIEFPFAY